MELVYLEIPQQAIMLNSWGMKENTACAGTKLEINLPGLKGDASLFIIRVNIHEVSDWHNLTVQ